MSDRWAAARRYAPRDLAWSLGKAARNCRRAGPALEHLAWSLGGGHFLLRGDRLDLVVLVAQGGEVAIAGSRFIEWQFEQTSL